jgi:glyoxylase-like metal-dependent hydrolase (beta-lactamase superfamily II)
LGRHPLTVVPGVHLLGGLAPAAAYVVETSEGLVLIDTGLDGDARLLKQQMESLGLDWRRIRFILLSHLHADHSGGARHLRKETGAKVYAGKGDAAALRAGGPRLAFLSTFDLPRATLGPTPVDVELGQGQVIAAGDARFHVWAAPGHTPGSVCYLMERGDQRILFSGDVIMSLLRDERCPPPLDRPLGTYMAYLPPRYRGSAADFLSTLRRLREMPAPQLVLPGHPRRDIPPQSPAMTRQRWEALLDPGIREMEQLQARYAKDGADFLDGSPKKLLPDLYYLGDLRGVAVYGLFAASKFLLVGAPGGPDLSSFLDGALRQLGREPVAPAAVLLTSADAEETSGLPELVRKHHALVVAPTPAWEILRTDCPATARVDDRTVGARTQRVGRAAAATGTGHGPGGLRAALVRQSRFVLRPHPRQTQQRDRSPIRPGFFPGPRRRRRLP